MRCSVLCSVLLFSLALRCTAQSGGANLFTVRANLLKTLDSNTVKPGGALYLRTSEMQQGPDCTVAGNTSVKGTVTSVEHLKTGLSRVALGVEFAPVTCAGSDRQMRPLLVAIQVEARSEQDSAAIRMATAGAESRAIAGLFSPVRSGMPTSEDTMLTSKNVTPTITSFSGSAVLADLTTGEVRGLRGLTLALPSKDAATRMNARRAFQLNQDATLVLALVPYAEKRAPTADAALADKSATGAASRDLTAAPGKEKAVPPEICADSGCQEIVAAAGSAGGGAVWTLPLAKLGFKPRPDRVITELENSATVHFLGPDQVLVTFALHTLVKRSAQQSLWAVKPRQVRAVLFSRTDGHLLKMQDWVVPTESGPYMWSYQTNSILVQLGDALVVLGPDLVQTSSFTLPGPLCFVSTAPGGGLVLLATVHERHNAKEHHDLSDYLGPGQPVDEDYELTGLGAGLQPIGSRLLQTRPLQPGILKTAMISARQRGADRWELFEATWEGQNTVLAQLRSSCALTVSSLPGDRVLVRGCTPDQMSSTWYRVLSEEGKVLLKGSYNAFDLLQQADTDMGGRLFAVASSHFSSRFSFVPEAHAGQFTHLDFSVYSAAKGQVLFAVHLPTGSPEAQAFSLSDDGKEAAVLTTDALRLYSIANSLAASTSTQP